MPNSTETPTSAIKPKVPAHRQLVAVGKDPKQIVPGLEQIQIF